MNTQFGTMDVFDERVCSIESYLKRMASYFIANKIKEDIKIHVFLSMIGPKMYDVISKLIAPNTPEKKTLDEIADILLKHYNPTRMVTVERYKFNKRCQENEESMADYIVAIRDLARTCEFGTFLDDALRDRVVCGIKSDSTRMMLLKDENLTMEKATKIACAMEMAKKESACFGQSVKVEEVHKMVYKYKDNVYNKCKYCGNKHKNKDCSAKKWKCFNCQEVGHSAKVCTKKKSKYQKSKVNEVNMTKSVCDTCDTSDSENEIEFRNRQALCLNHVAFSDGNNADSYNIEMKICGKALTMQIDTGA